MDIPDAVLGKLILVTTSTVCVLLAFWVNTYPFIDEESPLYWVVPDPQWFLVSCGAWGLVFVGGLMCFTLQQLRANV